MAIQFDGQTEVEITLVPRKKKERLGRPYDQESSLIVNFGKKGRYLIITADGFISYGGNQDWPTNGFEDVTVEEVANAFNKYEAEDQDEDPTEDEKGDLSHLVSNNSDALPEKVGTATAFG